MTSPTVSLPHPWCLSVGWALGAMLLVLSPLAGATQEGLNWASTDEEPAVSQQELDQILAPIALYPDDLLSQILMASTYPLEIVEAARFSQANPGLAGARLTEALEQKNWDPSVIALVNFPDVLQSLSEQLTWTKKIGDAVLEDEGRVFDTVQELRHKAELAGNLQSSDKLRVSTERSASYSGGQTIIIASPSPEYVYVPVYDPGVVYGTWWWPSYQPPIYYRPRNFRRGVGLHFGVGFACGAAWGFAWGRPDWHQRSFSIDLNRNARYNPYIQRNRYSSLLNIGVGGGHSQWHHNPSHRRGVSYHSRRTASKFNGRSRFDAQNARRSFRGYLDPRSSRGAVQAPIRSRTRTPIPRTRTTRESRSSRFVSPFPRRRSTQPTTRAASRGRSSREVQRRSTQTRRRRGK